MARERTPHLPNLAAKKAGRPFSERQVVLTLLAGVSFRVEDGGSLSCWRVFFPKVVWTVI